MNFRPMEQAKEFDTTRALSAYMSKVYAWMFAGLLITGLTAWFTANSSLMAIILQNSILMFGLIIAELVMVWVLAGKIETLTIGAAYSLFLGYSLLNGLTMSVIFLAYTAETIQQVFIISAGMFAALSFYGKVTKKDMTGLGKFMMMGLVGLLLTMFLNFFFHSSALGFAISFIGVIVFAGLTVYDTQKIREMFFKMDSDEIVAKGAIVGALALYLDFINLFLFLLRVLGGNRD